MAEPKKGQSFTFYTTLIDRANRPQFKASPTIAAGDFVISIDGGAEANLATLPSVQPPGSVWVRIVLSAAEMNGDRILVKGIDQAGDEWDDVAIAIDTDTYSVTDITGTGSVHYTITVTNGSGTPIDGVEVKLTRDLAGTDLAHGPKHTDAFGKVSFQLDPGTYYSWAQKTGYDFINPKTETVT